MQLNNRNAVITYTLVFLLICIAFIYVVRHSGYQNFQNLIAKFFSKSGDDDLNDMDRLEKLLLEGGDELVAYAEKLAQDENDVFMGDLKGRAGYESRGDRIAGNVAVGELSPNPSRIPISFSEFGKINNSKDDVTSDALNNIKRNFFHFVGLKKEEADAERNAHYARLEQLDDNFLSSKERQWKREEEMRRKKRVIKKRGATSEIKNSSSANNEKNIFIQSGLEGLNGHANGSDTKFKIPSMANLNSKDDLSTVSGNKSVEELVNRVSKVQLQQGEIPLSNATGTRFLKEPKILSLPSVNNVQKIEQEHVVDQEKRMNKRDDVGNVENEQKQKTTPCEPFIVLSTRGSKPCIITTPKAEAIPNPCCADVDSDGDDIAAAKLINGFMQSVMDQASKIGNLKSELGLVRKSDVEYQSFTNINKTVTNEFMSDVFGCVDKLIENTLARQVCGQLPPDMKRFLDWLLKSGVSKEQACRSQKENAESEFANFVFSSNDTRRNNANIDGLGVDEGQKFLSDGDKLYEKLN